MSKSTLALFLLIASLSLNPAAAREVAGVEMPARITSAGKVLHLNGMGLRKKLMFKVYVAGLYLEKKTSSSAEVIGSDQVKRVEMVMLRDLERTKITEAVEEGFEANNRASMGALRKRLDAFNAGIRDLREGDRLTITYVPGEGTILEIGTSERLVMEGADFAAALFSVWLGEQPVDDTLKRGMLGQ